MESMCLPWWIELTFSLLNTGCSELEKIIRFKHQCWEFECFLYQSLSGLSVFRCFGLRSWNAKSLLSGKWSKIQFPLFFSTNKMYHNQEYKTMHIIFAYTLAIEHESALISLSSIWIFFKMKSSIIGTCLHLVPIYLRLIIFRILVVCFAMPALRWAQSTSSKKELPWPNNDGHHLGSKTTGDEQRPLY